MKTTMNDNEYTQNSQISVEAADYLLGEIEKYLREMLRLAKWAAGTELSDRQRKMIQEEINKLIKEVDYSFSMLTSPPTLKN